MKYQDFIPPILSRFLQRAISSRPEASSPRFFSTFADAQGACINAGYEEIRLVEVVFEKTKVAKDDMLNRKFPLTDTAAQSLLAVLLTLDTGKERERSRIIDFGGACGAHYFQLRPFLPRDLKLEWVVVETPAMVQMAKQFETDELQFCESLLEAKKRLQKVDLVHSSGTLQYVPDPAVLLKEFIACQPAHVFLNRLALSALETIFGIQDSYLSANGPGKLPAGLEDGLCHYPVTYFPKQRLKELFSPYYRVRVEFADTKKLINDKEIFVDTSIFWERN